MSKIVIIGAGHVGSHCAFALTLAGLGDEIVLIDIDRKKAAAQALDIADAAALLPHNSRVRDGWYEDCRDADIVVLASGAPRAMQINERGETVAPPRLSLLEDSVRMLADIVPRLKGSGFSGILISITNPCDVIAHCLFTYMDMPAARVFGTGTALDTARFNARLAESLGLSAQDICCLAMGEHGDSQIAPFSQARIGQGQAPGEAAFLAAARAAREGGASIIQGKGSTEFGIGAVLMRIAKAILTDEHCLLPVSAHLEGQYGQRDVYAGVPAIIGRGGVERIVELALTPEELAGFGASCEVLQAFYRKAVTIYETML